MERISAGFSGPIASAVVAEINRIVIDPPMAAAEGTAYKAAFARMLPTGRQWGPDSPVFTIGKAVARDRLVMVDAERQRRRGLRPPVRTPY